MYTRWQMETNMRHVFELQTKKGPLKVGTNDVEDLTRQQWFREMIGESIQSQNDEDEKNAVDGAYVRRLERNLEKAMQKIDMLVEERERRQSSERQSGQSERQGGQSGLQQYRQPQVQEQQAQEQSRPADRPVSEAYLETPPNRVTESMWAQLTAEQQERYAQKWLNQK